jgi:hypothetical protein
VYHYTRASTLTNYILRSGQLRLSRFKEVNDPRESQDWKFNYRGDTVALDFDSSLMESKLDAHLKHSWRIGCFVSDPYEAVITKARRTWERTFIQRYMSGGIHVRGCGLSMEKIMRARA